MGRLENKIARVTGGGSGTGKAIALAFAREHADVCIADINLAKEQQAAGEVEQTGRKVLAWRKYLTLTRWLMWLSLILVGLYPGECRWYPLAHSCIGRYRG